MGKISELPTLTDPNGTELVPVVIGGVTRAAPIGALAGRAVDTLAAAIGIEPAPGGWLDVVVDRDGRVIAGYHPALGAFDAARIDLQAQVDALRILLGDVQTVHRLGGWVTVEIDSEGRVVRGTHALLGEITDDVVPEVDADRALALAELRSLRYRDLPDLHPSPPRIIRTAGDAPLIPDANAELLALLDPRITDLYARIVEDGGYARGRWITYGADNPSKGAQPWGRRFITDSPKLEFQVYPGNEVEILVDGKPLTIGTTVTVPNDGGGYYVSVDFGDDARTIHPAQTLAAGGAGYVPGDILALPGGTGAPMELLINAVTSAGAVLAGGWSVRSWGSVTALPQGEVAATGGRGTGARFTLSDNLGGVSQVGHTTRKMRRVEIVFGGGNGKMGRLRITKGSSVRPWPVAGPRAFIIQDSWGQVFHERPRGGWWQRMMQRLGIEDAWSNTIGGTGFVASASPYHTRLPDILDNLPLDGRPVILMAQGSINDRSATAAAIQAASHAFWSTAFSQMPATALLVHVEMMRAVGDVATDALAVAGNAGFLQAQAQLDPAGKRSGLLRTRAPLDLMSEEATRLWFSGDNAHLSQPGHDMLGDAMPGALIDIINNLAN